MKEQQQNLFVGIFILVIGILSLVSLAWISGAFRNFADPTHRFQFSESVAGLNAGADVTLHGIKIGEVLLMALDETTSQVFVDAKIDPKFTIYEGAEAELSRNLVSNNATINITQGSKTTPMLPLREGSLTLVPVKRSSIARITQVGEAILTDVEQITQSASEVMAKFTTDSRVDSLIESVSRTQNAVEKVVVQLEAIASDDNRIALQNSLENLSQFSEFLVKQEADIRKTFASSGAAASNVAELTQPIVDVSRTIKVSMEQITNDLAEPAIKLKARTLNEIENAKLALLAMQAEMQKLLGQNEAAEKNSSQ